jgi:uncharacterized membrane protein/protein-disulfide isomerase
LDTYQDRNHFQKSWPWWRWIFIALNITALILSAILSWHYLQGSSMIGCGSGSPCDQILNSKWSMLIGVLPVSGLAVGVYFALLVAGFFIGPTTELQIRRIAWSTMLILVGSIAGSAVWFTIVMKWIINDFCLYCITVHITGLFLTVLIIWRGIKEFGDHSNDISLRNHAIIQNVTSVIPGLIFRPLPVLRMTMIGLILSGIMAVFQVGFNSQAIYSSGESQYSLLTLDYHTVPMVGSPDAPYVVTLLFDYKCTHCQKVHFMLDGAIRSFNGKLAFVLCPTPLNTQCNPYIPRDVDEFKNSCELARIGLAVWLAKREAFPAFENWMFTFESGDRWRPRSLDSARIKAIELLGQEKFEDALADPWIVKYLHTCIQIYGQTIHGGNGGVPKLIFGSRWIIPEPYNADDLVKILQKSLALPNPRSYGE